jgi:BlaI family transcriptional regulator, penicillinase repressor
MNAEETNGRGRAEGSKLEPGIAPARRRAILDLAPLELECMNALWPLGQATVREIRDRLSPRRPRAYTTIMTIMDRLAQKGVVSRRKVGRAYCYVPNLSAEQARSRALAKVVEGFFGGSAEALRSHLGMPFLPAGGAAGESAADAAADVPAASIDETLL